MSAPQLGTEVLNFADRIVFEGGNFPWVTGLDITNGATEICGPIIYSIQAVSYVENFAQPLIIQDGYVLTLQPSNAFLPGRYELSLTGQIQGYDISRTVSFFVDVSSCSTILSDASVQGPITLQNTWFQADQNGASIQQYLDMLTQEPNCGFGYQYTLLYVDNNGALIQPPPSVNVVSGVIYIEKCLNPSQDIECSQTPYTIVHPMILQVYLDDGNISTPSQQMIEIEVVGTLTDPCVDSNISLTDTTSEIFYTIADGSPAQY